jgi:hypothetical protein
MSKMRARIDRTYLFGDTLMKSGGALALFTAGIGLLTPFTLRTAPEAIAVPYALLICGALGLAAGLGFAGMRMRRAAARLDRG